MKTKFRGKVWLYLAAAVVLIGAAFVWAFRAPAVPVEVAAIKQAPFEQTIDDDGKTRVRERYVVSAPLTGRMSRLQWKVGDRVQVGQRVALLSPSAPALLDVRTVRELEERVGIAQASLAQARAEAARADVALTQAQNDRARNQQLESEGFLSAAARDQLELAVRAQEQALAAARSGERAAEHNLAQARAALMRAREQPNAAARGAMTVTAPASGQVLKLLQESESVVLIGTPLMEIGDPSDLEIVVDVLSTDATRIAVGAPVRIDAGTGVPLQGRVRRVEPSAFTKVSALGIEEQRVNVVIDFVSPPEQWRTLGDNYRVDVRIVTFARSDAVVAPISSLFRNGNAWAVYVLQDGRAVRRDVTVGSRTAVEAWIERGLAAGDTVIVYPSDSVRDGAKLKVVRGAG
jgi:HlyD family secretion protein